MSELLIIASAKETLQHYSPSHHHPDSFITPEDGRHDACQLLDDTTNFCEEQNNSMDDSDVSDSSAENEGIDINTYLPSGYLSPQGSPSYMQRDFYSLSPQSSRVPEVAISTPAIRRSLPFSIDSILGNTADDSIHVLHDHTSADVTASLVPYLPEVRFSLEDWDFFQQYRCSRRAASPTQTSPSATARTLFWCHVCNDTCVDSADADAHQQFHNNNADICRLQREMFRQNGYVSVHSGTNHWNKVMCGLCKKIVFRHFFSRHIRRHDGHVCKVCDKEFSTNANLHDHVTVHTDAKHKFSSSCDVLLSDRDKLDMHNRRHNPCIQKCQFCSKSFRSKYACAAHERVHTSLKPFRCPVFSCNKAFSQKIHMRLHLKIHYQC